MDLKKLREVASKATPGDWGHNWSASIPFYVDVKKPAQSCSKHDHERPTYWRYEDGIFASVFSPRQVLELLDEIERLQYIEFKYESCSKQT
jgi:hypothetical protein